MATILKFPDRRADAADAPKASVGGNPALKTRLPGAYGTGASGVSGTGEAPTPPASASAVSAPVPLSAPTPATSASAAPPPGATGEAHRKAMLSKIHIKLRGDKKRGVPGLYNILPGFTDDMYRFILQEKWGVFNAAELSNERLHQLLLHLQALVAAEGRVIRTGGQAAEQADGRTDGRADGRKGGVHTGMLSKIEALLAEKGRAEGRYVAASYAEGILKRQTGGAVERLEQASETELRAVIAALDRDAKRKDRRMRATE